MQVLKAAGIPFLVGGAYAVRAYAGVMRDTKDFDLMVRRSDVDPALAALQNAGYRAEVVFPHWIAKAHHGECFIDIIYSSGNGVCPIDDEWFRHARPATILGEEVALCPPEEMIWQKAYIMERERFDGADIAHLIRWQSAELDWERLLWRFGGDGRVLLAHLLLVRFIYPAEPELVPDGVLDRLLAAAKPAPDPRDVGVCNGPLLSRSQYLGDIDSGGYRDARIDPRKLMTESELRLWTSAAESSQAGPT